MSGQRSGALDEDNNDEEDDFGDGNNVGDNMDDGNDNTLMAGGCSMRESEPVPPPPQPAAVPRYDGGRFSHSSRQHGSENGSRSLMNVPHHQRHRCGSFEDNSGLAVFCWGRGEDGQLGLGDTADQDEPVYVSTVCTVREKAVYLVPTK
jgi:Regulator of chromosome condensation (RCC1) repeat